MYRRQIEQIRADLEKKLVFLVGPRQVGKTWLAKEIGKNFDKMVYLNYDRSEDRQIMKAESWPKNTQFLILDELHKMKGWKNYIKGVFDTKEADLRILVTGSARLNTFRQAGDSMVGRFFVHHLFPFSMSEIKSVQEKLDFEMDVERFLERGGFPEPFLAKTKTDADRWRKQYFDGLVRTDVLDFETIHNFRALQMVLELLRKKVGSPVSYSSIAEDVQLSPITVKKYIEIFEALYIIFRVSPYSKNIARSILKEPKIYFFDNGLVNGDEGARLENFVAVSLLKHVHGSVDYTGKNLSLNYVRTKNKQEVDFALVEDGEISKLIEVKVSDGNLSSNLKYFCDKYNYIGVQVVKDLKREKTIGSIDIVMADNFLQSLFL